MLVSSHPHCVFLVKPGGAELRSGLLIINLDVEKVTAGWPAVTVSMVTLMIPSDVLRFTVTAA